MKKLLTNLSLIITIISFISATPGNPPMSKPVSKIVIENLNPVPTLKNIHPLCILDYKFN